MSESKPLSMKVLQEQLDALGVEVRELRVQLGDHHARLEQVELAKPAELRRLSYAAVATAIAENAYVTFEVLADWNRVHGSQFTKGAKLRADLVPHLVDYVKHGLLVGVPEDQDAMVTRIRAQAKARDAKAVAEVGLAKAAASRAEAELAERRAKAVNYDGGEEVVLPPMGA